MTTSITFDMTAILEMVAMALMVAFAVRLPQADDWLTQAKRGAVRAAVGCVVAVAAWSTIQVIGQLAEPAVAPKWAAAPIISIPVPNSMPGPGFAVRPGKPGTDI